MRTGSRHTLSHSPRADRHKMAVVHAVMKMRIEVLTNTRAHTHADAHTSKTLLSFSPLLRGVIESRTERRPGEGRRLVPLWLTVIDS